MFQTHFLSSRAQKRQKRGKKRVEIEARAKNSFHELSECIQFRSQHSN